jgi:hypothetical protein
LGNGKWAAKQNVDVAGYAKGNNGTACFKKRKQLYEYKHLLLETSGGQISNPYLNVHFLNTRAD